MGLSGQSASSCPRRPCSPCSGSSRRPVSAAHGSAMSTVSSGAPAPIVATLS